MRDYQEEKLEWECLLYFLAVELMADILTNPAASCML